MLSKKISLSLLVALVISLAVTYYVSKSNIDRYEIEFTYNVNDIQSNSELTILFSDYDLKSVDHVKTFVKTLSTKILRTKNSCASLSRTSNALPILLDYEANVSITLKKEDSSYFIYGIAGMFDINREDECLIKKESIESELSKVFNKSKMTHTDVASKQDNTGKSRVVGTYFYLKDGGNASVQCYLFTKEANLKSGLDVTIRSEELSKYLRSL